MRKLHEDVSAVYNLLVEKKASEFVASKPEEKPDTRPPVHADRVAGFLSGSEVYDLPAEPENLRDKKDLQKFAPIEQKAVDSRHIKAVKIAR